MVSSGALSRESRREQTRAAIVEAATELFAHKGIDATSFEHIARKIGLTKGAVYWHFENKDQLIKEVTDGATVAGDMFGVFDADAPLADRLEMLAERTFETARNLQLPQLWLDLEFYLYSQRNVDTAPSARDQWRDALAPNVQKLIEICQHRGESLPVPPREFLIALLALSRGLVQQLVRDPESVTKASMVKLFRMLAGDTNGSDATLARPSER